ncbi:MAG TPA: ABC transporter substrate-binding protein [Candidatus Binatia bacterium]
MPGKIVFLALIALILNQHFPAEAQQPQLYKIGWLAPRSAAAVIDRFRREIENLGYVEGKNVAIESRYAYENLERFPALAEELVRLKPDVILTRGTPETIALKNATKTIPIVFYSVTDPVGSGLVASLARPGANITGFSSIESILAGKRLELLKETVPKLTRVAVLWNPQDLSSSQQWKESQAAARELGLEVYSMAVSSGDKYENAFKEAIKTGSAALAVIAGSLEDDNRNQILTLASRHQLPAIYPRVIFVDSGGLMSYGSDPSEPMRRAAVMVDKILKGAKPADLPVEQASKFVLIINLKTAKQIGLTIPQSVFARAHKVIR